MGPADDYHDRRVRSRIRSRDRRSNRTARWVRARIPCERESWSYLYCQHAAEICWTRQPDLPFRLQKNIPLNAVEEETVYRAEAEQGYTTYPFSEKFLKSEKGEVELAA